MLFKRSWCISKWHVFVQTLPDGYHHYTIKALGPGFCKGILHYTEFPETFFV